MADTWKPAFDLHFNHNGTLIKCGDLTCDEEHEEFETTNTESYGWHEYGVGVRTFKVNGTFFHEDGDTLPTRRTTYTSEFSDGNTNEKMTGKFRIMRLGKAGGGRGALRYSFSGTFTGSVTPS
jgi:hypothetical protein